MQSRVSLLSRLRSPEKAGDEGTSRAAARVREDVLQHLRQICQTRLGSAPSSPSLGLPDLTDVIHAGGETPSFVTRALKRAIDAHEPRLTAVQVIHVPGEAWDNVLRFEIHGQLVLGKNRSAVKFETRLDPSRQVMIR
jgi:type VI secretion system protein